MITNRARSKPCVTTSLLLAHHHSGVVIGTRVRSTDPAGADEGRGSAALRRVAGPLVDVTKPVTPNPAHFEVARDRFRQEAQD
jgi:hypothetical protein